MQVHLPLGVVRTLVSMKKQVWRSWLEDLGLYWKLLFKSSGLESWGSVVCTICLYIPTSPLYFCLSTFPPFRIEWQRDSHHNQLPELLIYMYVVLGQLYSSSEGSAISQSSAVDPSLDINQWGTKVYWTSSTIIKRVVVHPSWTEICSHFSLWS